MRLIFVHQSIHMAAAIWAVVITYRIVKHTFFCVTGVNRFRSFHAFEDFVFEIVEPKALAAGTFEVFDFVEFHGAHF